MAHPLLKPEPDTVMQTAQSIMRTLVTHCPLCASKRQRYAFYRAERRYVECVECNLIFLNPSDVTGFSGTGEPPGVMREKADYFLSQLLRYRGSHGGAMLVIC